jgi:hypothetical protein
LIPINGSRSKKLIEDYVAFGKHEEVGFVN